MFGLKSLYTLRSLSDLRGSWVCWISALCVCALWSGCSRSPLTGSANYDCDEGDRVIVLERLFCVYTSAHQARPEPRAGEQMSAGEQLSAGEVMNAGAESMAGTEVMTVAGDSSSDPFCPVELPELYVYDTFFICAAEGQLELELIESVVAAWSELYAPDDMSPTSVPDLGVTDEGVGILSVRDASITP